MKKSALAVAVAAAMGATGANAIVVTGLTVTQQRVGAGTNGVGTLDVSGATATYSYDTVTGALTGSGLHNAVSSITPTTIVFSHNIQDLAISSTSASATSFSCVEGNFGTTVGASICGNYTFGPNNTDEGGPGNGDDAASGPAQSIADYDLPVVSWNGTTLVLSNLKSTVYAPGVTVDSGTELTLAAAAVVPVPAAVWLFGSALGILGWVRRRVQA